MIEALNYLFISHKVGVKSAGRLGKAATVDYRDFVVVSLKSLVYWVALPYVEIDDERLDGTESM